MFHLMVMMVMMGFVVFVMFMVFMVSVVISSSWEVWPGYGQGGPCES